MGESFVDVSYRGLEVGKRLRLRDVRSETGYVEVPLPMPVGTRVEIVADGGLRIEAMVTGIHEQVGGSDAQPGMRVKPVLSGASATWWQERVDAQAEAAEKAAAHVAAQARAEAEAAAAAKVAAAPVTDTPAAAMNRSTTVMSTDAVKEALAAAEAGETLEDDGKRTDVMAVVDVSQLEGVGKTTVMDAIDISMITGEPTSDVGAASNGDDDDVEMTVESSGEISGELEMTPSGRVTGGNGKASKKKPRSRKGKR